MTKTRILAAAAALVTATVAASPAAAMTVAEFVRRADAVVQSGLLAPFNSDFPVLRGEVRTAIATLHAEEERTRAARRRPAFCLPPRDQSIDPMDMLEQLRALSPAQQRLQLAAGLRLVAIRRFPCA